MQYIVLDLEWNQALTKELVRKKGFALTGEIIQIGAVRLTPEFLPADTLRLAVAPRYYKKMHWSVRKLTGISTKSLSAGIPFPQAYEQFCAWCGEDCAFLTWGPDDLPMLKSNLRLHNLSTQSLFPSYDLQRIFSRMTGETKQYSLSDALSRLDITDIFPPHDALNDALNTARICARLPLEEAILHYNDPLPAQPAPAPASAPAVHYASCAEMMRYAASSVQSCPECGAPLQFGKWIRRAPGKRITLASCSCGASVLWKLHWRENEELGGVDAVSALSPASPAQENAYRRALAHRRKSRRRASEAAQAAPIAPSDK